MKEGMEIDVSGLVSDAQELMLEVSRSYIEHTSLWFIGLMAHGSVVKGGFIPGCSDVDLHLYLEDDAFRTPNHLLLLDVAFRIRLDLLKLDPAPFRYVQCYPQSRELRPGCVRAVRQLVAPLKQKSAGRGYPGRRLVLMALAGLSP